MTRHRVFIVLLSLVAAFVLGPRIAYASCGDGVLDPGEECDPGPDGAGDCCTSTCTIMATCPAPDECHDAGSCDLTTGLCSNLPKPDGTTCNTTGTCRGGRCATPMTIRLARLRGVESDVRRGGIVVLGKFVTVPPDALSVTSGLSVHVTDAANLDVTIRWAPEECHPGVRGALCITKPVEKAQLPAHPDYYGVKLRLLALDIHEPFQPPVTVTIMQDSNVDRVGTISACILPSRGGMNCQQPYGS